jgi:hypothetical protein
MARILRVRWVGLFDAVAMMGPFSAHVPGGWAHGSSPNVQSYSHVVHSATTVDQAVFPSQSGVGTPYRWPGQPITHQGIGQDPAVLQWMILQAWHAGVVTLDIDELPAARGQQAGR